MHISPQLLEMTSFNPASIQLTSLISNPQPFRSIVPTTAYAMPERFIQGYSTLPAPFSTTPLKTQTSAVQPGFESVNHPRPPNKPSPVRPIFRPWLLDDSNKKSDVASLKSSPPSPCQKTTVLSSPTSLNGPNEFHSVYLNCSSIRPIQSLPPQSVAQQLPPWAVAGGKVGAVEQFMRSRGANWGLPQDDESRSALEVLATGLGKSPSGYRCIYCGKFYSRKYGLKIHLRTHTGFKPLKCKVCQRAFGDPSNLNKHTRLHIEQGALQKCAQCGKLVCTRAELDAHVMLKHQSVSNFGDHVMQKNQSASRKIEAPNYCDQSTASMIDSLTKIEPLGGVCGDDEFCDSEIDVVGLGR